MQWIYLLIASIFEVGWPLGLKIATNSQYRILWIVFAIIAMALSGIFLYLAQKQIPIGTAYAIWTGIGASCTFLIGVLVFHDILNLMRALGVILIIAGVVLLKLEA
ncbi:multidrug efflux SMR transporter [bacterium]|nr:multidrug efflux SMR transporter [bacterium]